MLKELCKRNPYSQGIIFCGGGQQCEIVKDALDSGNPSFSSAVLESNNVKCVNEIINAYKLGAIQYILVNDYSPLHTLHQVDPKIIINFELRKASSFLKRACIAKYQSSRNKIHYISILDENQSTTYEQVEANFRVSLVELPSNVSEVLADGVNGDGDAKTDG
mmetsp:Transcript_1335/g.2618  ORF Transcript_1335/g.2618 Transcript_1335/m.2618 type:complete len:163 (-) Transcript_1335:33-521(-)